jgi:hypothetical protein
VHADAAGAPDFDRGVGHFQQQARTVFQGAAVVVGALVGAALQELVEQVAVGAVDFHAVETGGLGVLGTGAVGVDDVGDFSGFQGARGRVVGNGRTRLTWPLGWMALGATGFSPFRYDGWEIRPTCHSCRKILPPARGWLW